VDSYKEMWHFDDKIALALKLFTGEIPPSSHIEMLKVSVPQLRDKRRVFLTELRNDIVQKIISFFTRNKILVVSDILKGRGGFAADWMLVTRYNKKNDTTTWIVNYSGLKPEAYHTGTTKSMSVVWPSVLMLW